MEIIIVPLIIQIKKCMYKYIVLTVLKIFPKENCSKTLRWNNLVGCVVMKWHVI